MEPTVIHGKEKEHLLDSVAVVAAVFLLGFLGATMLGLLGVAIILTP